MIIETERLTLRPLRLKDAPALQKLLDDPTISGQLPSVPYPLPEGAAEDWIKSAMNDLTFACVGREPRTMGVLGGFVGLSLEPGNRAQIGGWCGKQFRHNGYAIEAAQAVVRYGYESLDLETIYAIRKGRLWVATREGNRSSPFRHEPNGWHILDGAAGDGVSRNPIAWIGQRLRRTFWRS